MRQFTIQLATAACFAAALFCVAAPQAATADDLFSSESLKQVFDAAPAAPQTDVPPSPPQQTEVPATPPQQLPFQPAPQSRALEPSEIPTFLMMLGYQAEDLGDGVYKTTVKKGEWTLPYAFVISPNKSQFWVTLSLNTLKEGVQIPAEKMLKMLEFNHQFGPIHFAFSGDSRRIYVCRALKNDGLDPAKVKEVIETLAELALKHEDLWNHEKWTAPQQPQAQVQQPPQTPAQPAPRHVGTWRAQSQDGSTFQLPLNADGTFVLYHVQSGKTDKSVGRYSLIGNSLTLTMSQNDKLESFITWYTNGTWRFQVKDAQPGAQGLLFAKV